VLTTAALVPAAGRGERLGPGEPKALRLLAGEPLLHHAVRTLLAVVDLVVVAAPADEVKAVRAGLAVLGGQVLVVPGGSTRQQSVALALQAVPPEVDVVLVHDAARPLTPVWLVAAVVEAVRGGTAAVVPGLPVADTIKRVNEQQQVVGTLDRSELRAIQTPQGFARELLVRAHAAAGGDVHTDDAGLVERLGGAVTVIPGSAEAFKVTHAFDLVLAESLLAARAGRSA